MTKTQLINDMTKKGYRSNVNYIYITEDTTRDAFLEAHAIIKGLKIKRISYTPKEVAEMRKKRIEQQRIKQERIKQEKIKRLQRRVATASRTKIVDKMQLGWTISEWEQASYELFKLLYL